MKMEDRFPKYKAAAVQMAPVWMDREATTEKVCRLNRSTQHSGLLVLLDGEPSSKDGAEVE